MGRKRIFFTCMKCGKRCRAQVGEEDEKPCAACGAEHPYSGRSLESARSEPVELRDDEAEAEESEGESSASGDESKSASGGEEDGASADKSSSSSEDLLTSVLGCLQDLLPVRVGRRLEVQEGREEDEVHGALRRPHRHLQGKPSAARAAPGSAHALRRCCTSAGTSTWTRTRTRPAPFELPPFGFEPAQIYSAVIAKKDALWRIERFFATRTGALVLHYSGHGKDDNGNWLLGLSEKKEEYISFKDIMKLWEASWAREKGSELLLLIDACHSGAWVYDLREYVSRRGDVGVAVQASCQKEQRSSDEGAWTREFIRYQKHDRISYAFLKRLLTRKGGQLPMAYASWGKEGDLTYDFGEFTLLNDRFFLREAKRQKARRCFLRADAASNPVKIKGLPPV